MDQDEDDAAHYAEKKEQNWAPFCQKRSLGRFLLSRHLKTSALQQKKLILKYDKSVRSS